MIPRRIIRFTFMSCVLESTSRWHLLCYTSGESGAWIQWDTGLESMICSLGFHVLIPAHLTLQKQCSFAATYKCKVRGDWSPRTLHLETDTFIQTTWEKKHSFILCHTMRDEKRRQYLLYTVIFGSCETYRETSFDSEASCQKPVVHGIPAHLTAIVRKILIVC